MKTTYCKKTPEYVITEINYFMTEVSRLPSVAVSEIAYHENFDGLFEDFVVERRRWLELSQMLEQAGWERRRVRSLFYRGKDDYVNKVTARWFPPAVEG